ncbi:L-fucose isomerase [Thermatribacter velox]|uniref:L-fucose isomerase n=1 Tax=Thermatribacter velox TaxID=3039681 RepID=A0ABZ2YC37_9BACT
MLNSIKVFRGEKRFVEDFPKIGIRPVVDGRYGGVRESLEGQTMRLARLVAEFLEQHLFLPNGERVKCILPDCCIGGVAEARMVDEFFHREGVGVSITVTPCWCYGSETMDMSRELPKAVWGFNGTERPGAVYLAAVSAAHNQKGLPIFKIYGQDVQDKDDNFIPEDVQEKLLKFARGALAVSIMKNKSYLAIGSVSMGIAGSIVDADFFEDYLGMRVEYVDMTEVLRRIEEKIYDEEELERALVWVRKYCKEGMDPNPPEKRVSAEVKEKVWRFVVSMAIIVRDLMVGNPKLKEKGFPEESLGHNAIIAGFQGQRHWTDHFPNGDFMEAILNSSFDWNGLREPYIVATENDCLNAVSMLFGHLLTNTAQIFADVRTYWSPRAIERVSGWKPEGLASEGIIHLINSGAAALDGTGEEELNGKPAIKPFWEITPEEVEKCLEATRFCYANLGYFRGGGFSSQFTTRGGMPVTISRINLVKGLGPVLQIAEGYTVELPPQVHKILNERTDPTWPTTWFVPKLTGKGAFRSVYSVMENWGANHCSICYGHVGDLFLVLASMLRIPVNMHNVEEERIFRPSVWSAFGTEDLEGADFRACKTLGPLYKK